jgi:hypothetical protein
MGAEFWVTPELLGTVLPMLTCSGYTVVGSRNAVGHVVLLVASSHLSPEVRRVTMTIRHTEHGIAVAVIPTD